MLYASANVGNRESTVLDGRNYTHSRRFVFKSYLVSVFVADADYMTDDGHAVI